MELVQMQYFAAVAELQHVTKAAEKLNITQPALSHSIARLEEELGVPLFERSGRNVQLNRYGMLFAKTVRNVLAEVERGKREIAELAHPETGTVYLAFLNILGASTVPRLIHAFRERFPGIRFELEQGNQQHIQTLLESGRCDMALLSPKSGMVGNRWVPLFQRKLFAVVPDSHPLAAREEIGMADLDGEPFVGHKTICGFRKLVDQLFLDTGFRPDVRYEAEDLQTVAGFVSQGLGVSILPDSEGLRQEGIRWLRIGDRECASTVGLEWKENRYDSPAAQRFREFLVERYADNLLDAV
ncbi:LysR family transcriptional regulator [Cohnella caldifontis]|uniref:LysR family transcriptional regulator n=1 Tax=Cohnella caldifontis TaxID=3027471 RepID=UPI0023ED6228|nr:LysR family transcriptional regulator [Cohnella sp. YIM B05605]